MKTVGKYKIEGDGVYGLKSIKPIGKGSVPAELRGKFTTEYEAVKAITAHKGDEIGKDKRSG